MDTVEQYSEEEESDSDESDDEDSDNERLVLHRAGVLFVKDYYNVGGANGNKMLLIVQTLMASESLNKLHSITNDVLSQ